MKTTLRLMFAVVILTGLALHPAAGFEASPKPVDGGSLNCLPFCMVALCPPGGCGVIVEKGVPRCGCLGALGVQ